MSTNETESYFSEKYLADSLYLWNHAAISLIDIRHTTITSSEPISNYTMPASGFIYTIADKAEVLLNEVSYQVERFGLFHGGNGTLLSIQTNDWLEYYMVLYKADESSSSGKNYSKLLKFTNPFRQQYGFSSYNPLFFTERFANMYEHWSSPTPLNIFYGKTVFYQIIYEIYAELNQRNIRVLEPDIVTMAKQYLDKHYNQTIIISELCDMLNISYSHFHRTFKKKYKKSPQEYLIELRLTKAMHWLKNSSASIREIADYCGFPDQFNFHRIFLKYTKLTPMVYREKSSEHRRDYHIENIISFPYNEMDEVSYDKLIVEGGYSMHKLIKNKTLVAAGLSLMLLLSACSAPAVNSDSSSSVLSSAKTSQTADATIPSSMETKVFTTMMGDIEVPVNPQRIGVWVYEQELYSLGVTPISISDTNYQNVWPDVPSFSYAPDKEELMSLEPDLLITYNDENFYKEYQDIAPVITIPLDSSPEDTLRFLGDLLNISDKAEAFINEFRSSAESAKKKIEEAGILGKTVALVEPTEDTIWIYDNSYGRGGSILYDYLGFAIPAAVKEELGDNHFIKISYEVLNQYCDADYIVVVSGDGYENLKKNSVWQSLAAVKANHVIEFDANTLNGRGMDADTLDYFTEQFLGAQN